MNKYLTNIAQINNLKSNNNYIYGEINDYMFTIYQVKSVIQINTNVTSDITKEQFDVLMDFFNQIDKKFGLYKRQVVVNETNVNASFSTKFKKDTALFSEYAMMITNKLSELGVNGADVCIACRERNEKILFDTALNVGSFEYVTRMHEDCNANVNKELDEVYDVMDEESNLFGGIIGAFFGALISSVVWIVIFLLGYVTSLGGIIIGLATNFGYKKMRGPRGIVHIIVVIVFIILAIVFAQYTCEIIAWYQLIAQEGYQIGLSDVGSVISSINYELAINPEYSSMYYRSLALGLFYGAIGIVYIIIKLVRENKKVSARLLR